MFKQSTRYLFLALAIAWAGVIFYLSSQRGIDTPTLFPGQDKLFHLMAFGMLAFLAMGAMRPAASGYRSASGLVIRWGWSHSTDYSMSFTSIMSRDALWKFTMPSPMPAAACWGPGVCITCKDTGQPIHGISRHAEQ